MGDAEDDNPAHPLSAATVDLGRGVGRDDPSPIDHVVERFEPRGELGRGGMGRVEEAFDRTLGRVVAIKHMLGDASFARFDREARITARLEHPGIVPVHEMGRSRDGTPYYVMRRIDGRPLAELVPGATLAARLALIPNVLAACEAVGFAHAHHIIHRDITPPNILVGPFGETLVIDWGLARELDAESAASGSALPVADGLTIAGAIAGTPGFLAPEQARGEAVDERADVFALGATLFYVLAGRPMYAPASAAALVEQAGAGHAPDWHALPVGVPADLRAIVVKAVASDAAQRYRDAGALAADLRQFVTGNLVGAHQYGSLARFARFARRHRAAFAVGAAGLAILAVVAILSVRRIVAERDDANAARALAETRQREALDAADQMLVQRARELAASDPVGAISLLRRLDASSSRWRDAWLAATAAWTHGIPFGFHGDHKLFWLQLAADSRHAVTTSRDSGRVVVYDLVARTRRTVATLAGVLVCEWIGDHALACTADDGRLAIVDTEHATSHALELRGTTIISDRRSHAFVETVDHRVVDLNETETHVLATDSELAAVSPDLGLAALWHGDALALWTPAGMLPIASFDKRARATTKLEIRDGAIVAIIGDEIIRWRIEADRVVEDGRWPRANATDLATVAGHIYAQVGDELRVIARPSCAGPRSNAKRCGESIDAPIRSPSIKPAALFVTTRGLGVLQFDGSIALLDGEGWSRIGPFATRFDRAELSLDGRFLAAVTDADELLVWDVGELRPRALDVPGTEQPIALTPPVLWAFDGSRGIVRHDGAGAGKLVLPGNMFPRPWYAVASDGRWAAVRDAVTNELTVYDATNHVRTKVGTAAAQAIDGDDLVIARTDGVLGRWQPGSTVTEIGRLPSAPIGFEISGRIVVAELAPQVLSRFELDTKLRTDATFHDAIEDIALQRGRAWIVVGKGELWRWDGGALPARVELAELVDGFASKRGRILAHTAHSLIALDVEPPRAVPAESRATALMGSDYIASRSARGAVSVIDLMGGSSMQLDATAIDDSLVANGDTIMFATAVSVARASVTAVELRVPHDPAALRRWLADVTNALPPESGQGGVWP